MFNHARSSAGTCLSSLVSLKLCLAAFSGLGLLSCRSEPRPQALSEVVEPDVDHLTEDPPPRKLDSFFLVPRFEGITREDYRQEGMVQKAFLLEMLDLVKAHHEGQSLPTETDYNELERSLLTMASHHNFSDLFQTPLKKGIDHYGTHSDPDVRAEDVSHTGMVECARVHDRGKGWQVEPYDATKYWRGVATRIVKSGFLFSYCLGKDRLSDDKTMLYYFHGVTGEPGDWLNRSALAKMRNHWRKKGRLPNWAAVSFGYRETLAQSGNDQLFFEKVVPFIEGKLGFKPSASSKRLAMGVSMGGFNATYLTLHPQRFKVEPLDAKPFIDAAVLICPALATIDTFSTDREFDDYFERNQGIAAAGKISLWARPREWANWHTYITVDPLLTGQLRLGADSAPMLIQASTRDEFGFDEGNRIFTMLARTLGAKVRYEEFDGTHCVMQGSKAADFLISHSAPR